MIFGFILHTEKIVQLEELGVFCSEVRSPATADKHHTVGSSNKGLLERHQKHGEEKSRDEDSSAETGL
jgi:hypothetical protein